MELKELSTKLCNILDQRDRTIVIKSNHVLMDFIKNDPPKKCKIEPVEWQTIDNQTFDVVFQFDTAADKLAFVLNYKDFNNILNAINTHKEFEWN